MKVLAILALFAGTPTLAYASGDRSIQGPPSYTTPDSNTPGYCYVLVNKHWKWMRCR